MADKSSSAFVLRPMVAADLAECARVAGLAFESDRHTQLKALDLQNPYNHEEGMMSGLQSWLDYVPRGNVEAMVAVDVSRQVLGWVVWGFRGFNSPEAREKHQAEVRSQQGDATEADIPANSTELDASKPTRDNLERYTGQNMSDWTKKLMPPGVQCMYIMSIVVHPQHQGRGVGSALIRHGTDKADREKVFCWVHASEAGFPMFAKQGFHEIGRLEIDLDHWNQHKIPAPEGSEAEWGIYTFRYMRREPVEG